MLKPATKVDVVQAILKQVEVSAALFSAIETDRTDIPAMSKARTTYFAAQSELLDLIKELLADG